MSQESKHEMKGALAFATWVIIVFFITCGALALAYITGWNPTDIMAWYIMLMVVDSHVKIFRLRERLDEKEKR